MSQELAATEALEALPCMSTRGSQYRMNPVFVLKRGRGGDLV